MNQKWENDNESIFSHSKKKKKNIKRDLRIDKQKIDFSRPFLCYRSIRSGFILIFLVIDGGIEKERKRERK